MARSEDESIVTVDDMGVLKAVGEGHVQAQDQSPRRGHERFQCRDKVRDS